MSQREIRAFDYVNQPYERVRGALEAQAATLLQRATKLAGTRSGELVAALSVDIGGFELSKDVSISIGEIREVQSGSSKHSRTLCVPLQWQALDKPTLFPVMRAELLVYALSSTETQVELRGSYEPPLGPLGGALDAVAGHRVAEAAVHRFVVAVVERLRNDLGAG